MPRCGTPSETARREASERFPAPGERGKGREEFGGVVEHACERRRLQEALRGVASRDRVRADGIEERGSVVSRNANHLDFATHLGSGGPEPRDKTARLTRVWLAPELPPQNWQTFVLPVAVQHSV